MQNVRLKTLFPDHKIPTRSGKNAITLRRCVAGHLDISQSWCGLLQYEYIGPNPGARRRPHKRKGHPKEWPPCQIFVVGRRGVESQTNGLCKAIVIITITFLAQYFLSILSIFDLHQRCRSQVVFNCSASMRLLRWLSFANLLLMQFTFLRH